VQRVAENQRLTAVMLAVMDTMILLGSGVAATWLRFGSDRFGAEFLEILQHPGFVAYAVIVQLLLATTFDLYRPASWRTRDYLLIRITALAVALMVAFAVGVYLVMTWRFGRGLLAITLFLSLPMQGLCRFLWMAIASMPQPRRAVVIGEGPIVEALQQELHHRPSPPFQIVAHLPTPEGTDSIDKIPEALSDVDLVVVASLTRDETVDHLAALNFRGTTVMDAAGAYAALTGRIPARQVNSRWFIATGDFSSLATSPFHHVQRFFDIVAASALLLITLPVSVLSALAILITSGSPVFYRQQRLGRFGRPFTLIKLRTMRVGTGENGPTFAVANDSRVTPVGRLLRRWRIDELPQLLNVMRGEMSLVGPRPERPDVATRLEREIPCYAYRYSVRPGITGWAQVHLPYAANTEDQEKKLEYDLYLLRHHGPAMYGIVLLRTLGHHVSACPVCAILLVVWSAHDSSFYRLHALRPRQVDQPGLLPVPGGVGELSPTYPVVESPSLRLPQPHQPVRTALCRFCAVRAAVAVRVSRCASDRGENDQTQNRSVLPVPGTPRGDHHQTARSHLERGVEPD